MGTLTLSGVSKQFGRVEAVRAVDLDILDGEFITLVGPSGCGKSTLLRMIAGLEELSFGSIRLDGGDLANMPPRDRDMAMVFQDYALYPHMTVRENLGFAMKMRKAPKKVIDDLVGQVAETLHLEPLLARKPAALSGGQRQRVALGRALIRQPALFLFDEPLSNLDAKLRVSMRMEIRKLQMQLGITSIYVTHDQTEAMTMADRIVVMNDGEVQQVGRPMDIYKNPSNSFVGTFIGSPPMSLLDATVERLEDRAKLDFGEGNLIELPTERCRALFSNDLSKVKVGIRCEHVTAPDEPSDAKRANCFRSDVILIEDHGADSLGVTLLGGREVIARLAPGMMSAGDKGCLFQIDTDSIHFFHAETGQAIG